MDLRSFTDSPAERMKYSPASIIFLFIFIGCGYTQLAKVEDIPFVIDPFSHVDRPYYPVAVFDDSLDVKEDYIVIDTLSSSFFLSDESDETTVRNEAIKEACAKGADAIVNLHFKFPSGHDPDPLYLPPPQPFSPPLDSPATGRICGYGRPSDEDKTQALGTLIKFKRNISTCDSGNVKFDLLPGLYYTIVVSSLGGEEIDREPDQNLSSYSLKVRDLPSGIYRIEFQAQDGPSMRSNTILWKTTRWVEILAKDIRHRPERL